MGRSAEDSVWIAEDLDTVVARQLFGAGLDLHVALGLIGDDRAVGAIRHAISGLDQAIRELRSTAYDLGVP
jgi:signal transduction histidine kinase